MRIVSKFKDYYDIGLAYGIDQELVYVRTYDDTLAVPQASRVGTKHTDHVFTKFMKASYRGEIPSYEVSFKYSAFIVGFCGKLHLGFRMRCKKDATSPEVIRYCYNTQQMLEFFEYVGDKELSARFERDIPLNTYSNRYERSFAFCYEMVGELFDEFEAISDKHMDYFREFKTPVFVVTNCWHGTEGWMLNFIKNACLKEFQFQRVVDSYTAFQKISMFIGGVLGRGEKETLQRKDFKDEPIIRDSKGFDKWSFKKRKQV